MADDAVLEILKVIQADIAGMKADMTSVKTDVRVHSRTLGILLQEGRLLARRRQRLRQGERHFWRG
jgi:hypothetical protein